MKRNDSRQKGFNEGWFRAEGLRIVRKVNALKMFEALSEWVLKLWIASVIRVCEEISIDSFPPVMFAMLWDCLSQQTLKGSLYHGRMSGLNRGRLKFTCGHPPGLPGSIRAQHTAFYGRDLFIHSTSLPV